jgi:small subunit ribosomal protein S2
MPKVSLQEMLDAGCHFGHLKSKWDPKMSPYILMEKNGIHLIDLNKTAAKLEEASLAIKNIVKSGRKIMFVATKKQAKEFIATEARRVGMPYVAERWLGGMLTNFATVRKSIKKMGNFERMVTDGTFQNINKRERLMITREKEKMGRVLNGIADQNRLPAALFIIDIKKEHIAVSEAKRLNIPTFAIVDTNSDPNLVDFPIPANDDSIKSIELITRAITAAIEEGYSERKREKEEAETKVAAEKPAEVKPAEVKPAE